MGHIVHAEYEDEQADKGDEKDDEFREAVGHQADAEGKVPGAHPVGRRLGVGKEDEADGENADAGDHEDRENGTRAAGTEEPAEDRHEKAAGERNGDEERQEVFHGVTLSGFACVPCRRSHTGRRAGWRWRRPGR